MVFSFLLKGWRASLNHSTLARLIFPPSFFAYTCVFPSVLTHNPNCQLSRSRSSAISLDESRRENSSLQLESPSKWFKTENIKHVKLHQSCPQLINILRAYERPRQMVLINIGHHHVPGSFCVYESHVFHGRDLWVAPLNTHRVTTIYPCVLDHHIHTRLVRFPENSTHVLLTHFVIYSSTIYNRIDRGPESI